jgi:imidazolonepropionase-like amidohydrolase
MRWTLLALLLAFSPADAPKAIAIKNATIVVAPGQVLEKASVVLRHGLIENVGVQIALPRDAEVLDGLGLTVYAGFIDGRGTTGLADVKRSIDDQKIAEGDQPDFSREAPPHMEQANRKGLRPELDAAEILNISEEAAKKAHAGGFTVARIAVADEFLSGRSALVTLSGRPRRNALVRGNVALHGGFHSYLAGGYPSTTMGDMAQLRQVLHDARHYSKVWTAWKPGMPRPALDAVLEAIQPALRGDLPLCFNAGTDREILRALALADEFSLRVEIAGGDEAWRLTGPLKTHGAPVYLTLSVPKEPEKKKDAEPEPARLVAENERIRKEHIDCARVLHEKRVRFCFSSVGLASAADALPNIATMVQNGLPADAALAALTTTPAALFGLDATHGTIANGKTANLTVLSAPLGDKHAKVRYVIADGHKFEYEAKAADEKKKDEKKEEPKPPVADYEIETEADRVPKTRTKGSVLIKNVTILTVADEGTIDGGSIFVREGKIAAVGRSIEAPEGITVIDATGLTVMPGIIDCHSHIAAEGGLNESTQTITPEVRIKDALTGWDVELYRAAASGVTAANILHGSANAIGGQNAVIKMKYGASPHDLLFPGAPRGVKFALGENPIQANFRMGAGKRFPNTRMGVEASIRRAFAEAREYEEAQKRDPLTRLDLRLEALLGVLHGEILVHCHCYRADEIVMILETAKANGFKVATLQHVLEGYRVAPEILASGAGASTFSDWWSYKVEAYEAIPYNAALLTRAGIVTSINSDLPHQIRHMNLEAAKTAKYGGLSEREALSQVTINAAKQLGIDKLAGTIEPGKGADLAFFNGHPLSPYSRCVMTLIDGELAYEKRDVPNHATPGFQTARRLRRDPASPPRGDAFVIANATIHPVSRPPYVGTLFIENGKIVETEPKDATRIDGLGLSVYPGLIDAHTTLGLREIGSVLGTVDAHEIGSLQPDLKALTAVNPHSELIPVTRMNGITSALARPSGGVISGQSALIRLDGWTPGEMALSGLCALHVEVPEPPEKEGKNEDTKEEKKSEKKPDGDDRIKPLRDLFEAAKRYDPKDPDPKLEALQPYLRGERPVIFDVTSVRQIKASLKFAEDLGLRPVLSGARDAWKIAPLLAEKKVPVILTGVMEIPHERYDPADARASSAATLAKAGVKVAISSAEDFHGGSRNTPYHAAWSAAHGLDRDLALKAVTLIPAEILGVADRVGSLDVGKDADVIVTTGDPLEVVTDVVYEFIKGRPVLLESKHTRLYEKFRQRTEKR